MTITKTQRAEIIAYLADRYDAATVTFHRDGTVTAKLNADMVPGCNETRLLVGSVRELLDYIKDTREANAASAAEFS